MNGRTDISDGLRVIAEMEASRRAKLFAERHQMGLDDSAAVLTTDQAEREYGTPDDSPEPWMIPSLEDFDGR